MIKPYYQDNTTTILHGDCMEQMRTMEAQSVNCCVTSPPYFGLRDYGCDGQIGLEDTPEAFVAKLVDVFREVRRVLRDDGTVWLNLGDSYVGSANNGGTDSKTMAGTQAATGKNLPSKRGEGLKPKDLIGIPWRVAFALQQDGWYLRQDIIWHKPNPMPESVTDRCTKAHEYVFLLSKSAKYFYDNAAIGEPLATVPHKPGNNNAKERTLGPNDRNGKSQWDDTHEREWCKAGFRNRRSVWTVNTQPYKGAHFATFPRKLIEPCILAGCPEGGKVLDPFGGSGTTAAVARLHNRKSVLCELNKDYIKLQIERLQQEVFNF